MRGNNEDCSSFLFMLSFLGNELSLLFPLKLRDVGCLVNNLKNQASGKQDCLNLMCKELIELFCGYRSAAFLKCKNFNFFYTFTHPGLQENESEKNRGKMYLHEFNLKQNGQEAPDLPGLQQLLF